MFAEGGGESAGRVAGYKLFKENPSGLEIQRQTGLEDGAHPLHKWELRRHLKAKCKRDRYLPLPKLIRIEIIRPQIYPGEFKKIPHILLQVMA